MRNAERHSQDRLPRPNTQALHDVFTVLPKDIETEWHWIVGFLRRVRRYDWTEGDVKKDLVEGNAQLWGLHGELGVRGIVITRIERYHDTVFGVLWIAAGDGLQEGLDVLDIIEKWFRDNGCEYSQVVGRAGWGRVLSGYRERARVFVRSL